jgi:hypothetical protein
MSYDGKKMLTWIQFVNAMNTLESLGQNMSRPVDFYVINTHGFVGGDYSIEWDYEAERWTLTPETDDAPELCAFNRVRDGSLSTDDCTLGDLCEDCAAVAERINTNYDQG